MDTVTGVFNSQDAENAIEKAQSLGFNISVITKAKTTGVAITSALVDLAIPENEVPTYVEKIKSGKILLAVAVSSIAQEDDVIELFENNGAQRIKAFPRSLIEEMEGEEVSSYM